MHPVNQMIHISDESDESNEQTFQLVHPNDGHLQVSLIIIESLVSTISTDESVTISSVQSLYRYLV